MQSKTTKRPSRLFLILLCVCGVGYQAIAQPQQNSNYLFKSSVQPTDSASAEDKSPLTSGAGTAMTKFKYEKANRLYYSMIDSLSKVLFRYPLTDTSSGLNYAEEWVGTPNMGLRRPNYVIIHHTANNSCEETLREFTATGGREASAHYVICKDGTVHHMLSDFLRSHHAGESKWGNNTDINSSSIGIELVNNGYQPFTEEQINSLAVLLENLKTSYKIPAANFIGHADIAPTRKADPSSKFPWKEMSEKGYGLWWDDTTGVVVPDNFDYLMGLRIIGYDISSPASAVSAFKRHFMGQSSGTMNADVRRIIYVLHRKFL